MNQFEHAVITNIIYHSIMNPWILIALAHVDAGGFLDGPVDAGLTIPLQIADSSLVHTEWLTVAGTDAFGTSSSIPMQMI